jgi:hypothetical protein
MTGIINMSKRGGPRSRFLKQKGSVTGAFFVFCLFYLYLFIIYSSTPFDRCGGNLRYLSVWNYVCGSTTSLIAVRILSSIVTSANSGTHLTLMPSFLRYPVARTSALTAWLTAPAPMACTSARWFSRITPAMAPATADVREFAETLI